MEWVRQVYHDAIVVKADPRTDRWFLVHSPWPPIAICVAYIAFCVKYKGLMKNVPALNLRFVLVIYNFLLVLLSAYMVYEFSVTSVFSRYSLLCQTVDYSTDPLALRMASVCWWYFISKYIELLDTLFFILRKKYNQVSFLHVYHHATMLINWWLGVKYVAGGQSFFIGLINSAVHVVMYTYYGLSAIGPHMQKYIWWKRYLTVIQLVQFVLIFLHSAYGILSDCDFPKWLGIMVTTYQVSLIVLFMNFYKKSYNVKKEK